MRAWTVSYAAIGPSPFRLRYGGRCRAALPAPRHFLCTSEQLSSSSSSCLHLHLDPPSSIATTFLHCLGPPAIAIYPPARPSTSHSAVAVSTIDGQPSSYWPHAWPPPQAATSPPPEPSCSTLQPSSYLLRATPPASASTHTWTTAPSPCSRLYLLGTLFGNGGRMIDTHLPSYEPSLPPHQPTNFILPLSDT